MAKYRVTKKMIDEVEGLTYEEQGLTPAVREKWERGKQGKKCLRIPISRETEEGETEDDLPNKKVKCIEIPLP